MFATVERKAWVVMGASAVLVGLAAVLHALSVGPIPNFAVCALALAGIAHLIGEATDQLGNYLSPAATGIIQSAVGNLPELFVSIFALQAGLVVVVQASLIGSILGNALLVLGLAFFMGGARHGVLKFESQAPRMIAILLLLAVCALVLPTLAHELHLPAAEHEQPLAVVCAIVLLLVLAVQTKVMLTQGERTMPAEAHKRGHTWPLAMAVGVLALCGIAAALVSDWFVEALEPAIEVLGISQAFAGLVVVAIAGNAVENVVGIRLAAEGKADLAVSVVLNSALQVAVALIPILILVSFAFGGAPFTLAIPPILAGALFLSVLVVTVVTVDGRADIVDGAALIGLYIIIATIFWWG
ncbi:calcium:proton antiporter [Manganibacter manganicus]|uniref:Sodium:proton exchanger n=1 Tax=Manganibacter manganicus TaxID=1873176 RepID=A0A1V8RNK1_9HYPH|nr:sodium:proton exchanger [Pseudaminobacter manganicus]OQM74780.1 sodium:proton exchanger [Pseudaminobacter manganicus]